jgi:hypothetical protein
VLTACHSEVFRGIWPDPSEYLGVTGCAGSLLAIPGPFYRSLRGIKLLDGRCHFRTCCPRNDDTFLGGWVIRQSRIAGNSRATTGCWQRGTRDATTFPEHGADRPVQREVLSRSQRVIALRRQSTNQGSVGGWIGRRRKVPQNASQSCISMGGYSRASIGFSNSQLGRGPRQRRQEGPVQPRRPVVE